MTKRSNIIIYTDGSSRGNPGPGGWGAIVAGDDRVVELGGGNPHTTNNKMELQAAISALTFSRDLGDAFMITVHADSSYVINGITKWVAGWEKNGWMTGKKEEVLNRDLWQELARVIADLELSGSTIVWQYAPGHAGVPGNERADVIATSFADKKACKLFDDVRTEYDVDLTLQKGDEKLLAQKKKKSSSKSGVKAYSYLSLVHGIIEKHATWAECEKRVKGISGVKFKKSVSASDEAKIIRSWGF